MSTFKFSVPAVRIICAIVMAVAILIISYIYNSFERLLIMTQKFIPDAGHDLPIKLKGKIFYVNAIDYDKYYLYFYLFLGTLGISFLISILLFMVTFHKKS